MPEEARITIHPYGLEISDGHQEVDISTSINPTLSKEPRTSHTKSRGRIVSSRKIQGRLGLDVNEKDPVPILQGLHNRRVTVEQDGEEWEGEVELYQCADGFHVLTIRGWPGF